MCPSFQRASATACSRARVAGCHSSTTSACMPACSAHAGPSACLSRGSVQGGARAGGAHRLRGAVCVFDPRTGRELEPALLLRCVELGRALLSSAEKWSMSGLKSQRWRAARKLHALVEECHIRRVLEPQRVGVCRATRLPLVPAPVCAAQPKLCGPSELPRELRVRCVVASEQWPCPQRTALSSFAA